MNRDQSNNRRRQAQPNVEPRLTAGAGRDSMSAMRLGATLMVAIGSLCSSLPLMAHHSFAAEYDSRKTITIHGVVQKVAWMNPHA